MLSRLLKKNTEALPAFATKKFFNSERKSFYGQLRRALPKCYIFPDVELSALIAPASVDPKLRRAHEELLAGRKVDYALFDARLNLLCVIEITPAGYLPNGPGSNIEFLHSAGIQRFSWEQASLPSTNQIVNVMADWLPPELDILGPPTVTATAAPVTVAAPPVPPAHWLTLDALNALAPDGHTKRAYPHIWDRICAIAIEPRQLAHYISTLSIQDRGSQRAGFPSDVLHEIAEIQAANDVFAQALAPTPRASAAVRWDDTFLHR
jgi:hypothetical protein